ncbi:MAG: OmpA family protein [Hyphomonadaceae bacterium]
MFWTGLAMAGAVALIGAFGLHPSSVWGVEQGLGAKVETALTRAGISNVTVDMDGQTARLSGGVSNNEVRARAIDVALRAIGPGGAWAGGVTRVDAEDLVSGAPISPFAWRAVRQGRGVVLSGHAPTPRVAREVREAARRAFPNGDVDDQMEVAPGAPNAEWADVASDALRQLARLTSGEVRMSDQHVIILGQGERRAVANVTNHYRTPLPAPYRARVEVFAQGEGLSFADLGDIDLAQGNAETCQTAFERMMARNVINFATGSAEIDRASLPVLDRLASIALRCDQFRIQIAGHTDNVGARDANMELSRRRAQAVAGYLIGQGVTRARLIAVGFGPDRPRASNASPVGQAANRRIEFTVST